MEIKRNQNETEEQFIWRLGQSKDNGQLDLDWDKIAEIINKNFRSDESEYRSEAAYRKPYQQAKRFYEAGVFNKYEGSTYIDELQEAQNELQRERMRLQDERTARNRELRFQARNQNDIDYLTRLIEQQGFQHLPIIEPEVCGHENDLIICLSDLHIGSSYSSNFGDYNSGIAANRLRHYVNEIRYIQYTHKSENAYVLLLGDMISGNIHHTVQLQNRENVIEQVKIAGELLSDFIWSLSQTFKGVLVNSVSGNHSRVGLKDNVLRDERLDDLIPWYLRATVQHLGNVVFLDKENIDATIGKLSVRGNDYLIVHGDYDSFDANGVSKLVMMTGCVPKGIFMGHKHRNSMEEIYGIDVIRSGCLSGSGDDYCIQNRLCGKPGQMVTVVDDNGIVSCYPIELE